MEKSPNRRLRVMVDSNVLIAGTIWRRFPYEVIPHATKGDYQLVLTDYILEEARRNFVRLRPNAIEEFEIALAETNYELVDEPSKSEDPANAHLVRDVKDVPIVLAAINAGVDYLISQDKDITDPAQPVHQRLKIILPGTFLREHLGWSSEALERIRDRPNERET